MDESTFRSIMLSDHGAILIDDADEHFDTHRAIVVREDTVIEEWLDADGLNLITYFGIASATLLVSDPVLLVPGGVKGAKLELTSGSVWLIR